MSAATRPCVVITTYARPDGVGRLLDDLERQATPGGLDVRVYDDATPNPGTTLPARLADRGWSYRRAAANHGKRGWWRWWNTILADLRRTSDQLFYVLQDDARLCEDFFVRSLGLWSGIADPAKASLYLHLSAGRAEPDSQCWTPVRAQTAGDVVHCGWLDLHALMCERRLFDALDWRLKPIDAGRWDRAPQISSGVGQQMSLRAHGQGLRMYRVARSLTVHDASPSLMNAAARKHNSMDTVDFVDGAAAAQARIAPRLHVLAAVASVPRREASLEQVVSRLLPQADTIGVYLNGYTRVPPFLHDERIEVVRSQDCGDRGDAGKFWWAGSHDGHHVVCDDDIAYPDDYVERLVAGIERHGRRAVVGFHGRIMAADIVDYHRSQRLLHFARAVGRDEAVHVLGSGVCGYHASAIRVDPADFEAPNMADVWLALLGQRQRVPFVCLEHEERWLHELPDAAEGSIYVEAQARRRRGGPTAETVAIRAHGRWELHEPPPVAPPSAPSAPVARRGDDGRRAGLAPARGRPLIRVHVTGPRHAATLVLPERDRITEAVQRTGTYYERDLLDAIRARAPTGTFVDVGARFGNNTTFFALECAADHVVAIEPGPHAHAGLLETLAENALRERVTTHRVDARFAPMDEILENVDRVGVVLVDGNGTSAEILAFGARTLRRDRPLVAAEAASAQAQGALRALMSSLGYREVAAPFGRTPTWLWEPVPRDEPPDVASHPERILIDRRHFVTTELGFEMQ